MVRYKQTGRRRSSGIVGQQRRVSGSGRRPREEPVRRKRRMRPGEFGSVRSRALFLHRFAFVAVPPVPDGISYLAP